MLLRINGYNEFISFRLGLHSRLFDLFIITVSVTIITVISVSISNVNNSNLYKGKGKCIRD